MDDDHTEPKIRQLLRTKVLEQICDILSEERSCMKSSNILVLQLQIQNIELSNQYCVKQLILFLSYVFV